MWGSGVVGDVRVGGDADELCGLVWEVEEDVCVREDVDGRHCKDWRAIAHFGEELRRMRRREGGGRRRRRTVRKYARL